MFADKTMASDAAINSIITQGRRLATHSWEYGAFAEALIEWYHPQYSVFGSDAFPGGKVPVLKVDDTPSLAYAKPHIWTNATTLADGDGTDRFLFFVSFPPPGSKQCQKEENHVPGP